MWFLCCQNLDKNLIQHKDKISVRQRQLSTDLIVIMYGMTIIILLVWSPNMSMECANYMNECNIHMRLQTIHSNIVTRIEMKTKGIDKIIPIVILPHELRA